MNKKNWGVRIPLSFTPHFIADANGNIPNPKRKGITISLDVRINGTSDYFKSEILQASDYYPFGSVTPGRSFTSNSYRYGFNGKENDIETVGTGEGTQDYGMRIYNPALGKFLSVDPIAKEYPWNSTYAFAENTPIQAIDLDCKFRAKSPHFSA